MASVFPHFLLAQCASMGDNPALSESGGARADSRAQFQTATGSNRGALKKRADSGQIRKLTQES
jgi:hypothetical protein